MDDADNTRRASLDTKWGTAITGGLNGYQLFPDAIVRNQKALGLDATDMVVLLNICMHWWETAPEKWPHPRPAVIAQRMGTTTRTVERHIGRLSKLGFLKWLPTEQRYDAPSVRRFDLTGLVSKLQKMVEKGNIDQNIAA